MPCNEYSDKIKTRYCYLNDDYLAEWSEIDDSTCYNTNNKILNIITGITIGIFMLIMIIITVVIIIKMHYPKNEREENLINDYKEQV